jgi:hypothetical protein
MQNYTHQTSSMTELWAAHIESRVSRSVQANGRWNCCGLCWSANTRFNVGSSHRANSRLFLLHLRQFLLSSIDWDSSVSIMTAPQSRWPRFYTPISREFLFFVAFRLAHICWVSRTCFVCPQMLCTELICCVFSYPSAKEVHLETDVWSMSSDMDAIVLKYFEDPWLGQSQFWCNVAWASPWFSFHSCSHGILDWCPYIPWVTCIRKCCWCYTSCLTQTLLQSSKLVSFQVSLCNMQLSTYLHLVAKVKKGWRYGYTPSCCHTITILLNRVVFWIVTASCRQTPKFQWNRLPLFSWLNCVGWGIRLVILPDCK